jgi:hypothetical protein
MPAHRRARLQDGAVADRLHDGAVLALEGFAIGALGDAGPAANRLSRDDEASEMFQKAPELRVSGGVRDAAMERKILRDRVFAALEGGADGSKHSTILRICDAEPRSAANPAASISMPVRNSITSSTARSGDNGSTSMRSGRRAFSGTKAPTP